MRPDFKTILIIILFLLCLGGGTVWYFTNQSKDKELELAKTELKREKIANDTLRQEKDGIWRKYVADTNTIAELNDYADSLKIEADKPRIVIDGTFKPEDEDVATPAEESSYADSIYTAIDYYPNKEESFVKHETKVDFINKTDTGKFSFSPINISMVVNELEGGLYETRLKAPDFIQVESFDFNALPLDQPEPDNFGILLGGGYGQSFDTGQGYLEIGTGIRYKKMYLEIEGNTNKQADIGIKFEF